MSTAGRSVACWVAVARNEEFERRLVDHPDDRETWTVYADWLESQGDPRGELIALELRFRETKNDAKLGVLFSAVYARVMTPLVEELEAQTGTNIGCSRGFISNVTLGERKMAAPLAAMVGALFDHPLSGLLSSLVLRDRDGNGVGAIAVLGERAPRSLRDLRLDFGLELASLAPLHTLTNLEELACSEIRDGSPALHSIAAAPWPLRKLDLSLVAAPAPSDAISQLLLRGDLQLE